MIINDSPLSAFIAKRANVRICLNNNPVIPYYGYLTEDHKALIPFPNYVEVYEINEYIFAGFLKGEAK